MNLQKANRTAREVLRHAATRLGLNGIVDTLRKAKGISVDHLGGATTALRFADIYDKRIWAHGHPDAPASGTGSTLAVTKEVRDRLPRLLRTIGSSTLIDIGCGDLTWMSSIELPVDYIGIDIVAGAIAQNQARHASPRRRFLCCDALADEIPGGDTVLCREILFHLSFADIRALLRNLANKPRRWLIATTDSATWFNADIRCGDYRVLDLRRPPFRFPPPDLAIDDCEQIAGRQLGVWRFDRLPVNCTAIRPY